MRTIASVKANRVRNRSILPRTRWEDGYEFGLVYSHCDTIEQFDRWAAFRKDQLQYDSRFTFVWLSRTSFEFNTSNGTIVIVTV